MSQFLNTHLFLGTHVNRIDGKGRVSFPAPFRQAILTRNAQSVVILRSPKVRAIEGMTVEHLQALAAEVERSPTMTPKQRAYFRHVYFGAAQELQIDKEGRCSPPKSLLDQIGIDSEITFEGCGANFLIWEPKAHADYFAEAFAACGDDEFDAPTLQDGII